MIQICGKYNTAIVYTDVLEETARAQIMTLCDQSFTADSQIRIMPDVHAGAGCTIGTTMTIQDKVVPNLVGVDIGCGMETIRLRQKRLELQKLDKVIHERIPAGFNIRTMPHRKTEEIDLTALRCLRDPNHGINLQRAMLSIGTLGGGNHFIEVDKDNDNNLYLIIHSGSRHLGLEVARYYQNAAIQQLNHCDRSSQEELIARYKAAGKENEIQQALKALKKQVVSDIPPALSYLSGGLFHDYIHDMKLVQHYALLNRQVMAAEILKGMKLDIVESFTTIHNYIDTEAMILRKGAVSAQRGEKLLIPINMRDGSIIGIGKGNPDWNCSAPHGAGRLMSRAKARESFTVSSFKKEMAGIYTTTVGKDTLDECPMAYKDMDSIINNIMPSVDIEKIIKPVYNFKAGDE